MSLILLTLSVVKQGITWIDNFFLMNEKADTPYGKSMCSMIIVCRSFKIPITPENIN